MSETTKTSEQGVGRAHAPGKGGLAGRWAVGEYVGLIAAEAAQTVRRAGLRPGLDRSFGCSPELFGQVVAQDPPAGGELARNGLVTLYVAAPSVVQADESDLDGGDEQAPAPEAVDAPSEQNALEWDPVGVADPTPARDAERYEAPDEEYEEPDETWIEDEHAPVAHDEAWTVDAPTREGRSAHVGAAPASVARGHRGGRREQSLTRFDGVRARFAEHPWLVGVVGGTLAVWAVVGVAAMLTGHRANADHKRVAAALAQRAAGPPPQTGAPRAPSAAQVRSVSAPTIPASANHQPRVRRVYTHGPRRAARRGLVMRIVAPQAETTGHTPPVTPEEAASAPAPVVTPSQAAVQERSSAEERVAIEFGPER